ncbi:hypothetical protein ACFQX7_13715 [Luedemannella flava]|uniref:hypothetical protein n=1 Tax=Luedemannella flava TaxID=349316 RepID=UPI0031CE1FBF
MPSPDRRSAVQVYVPFKYDIGGAVIDTEGAREALIRLCGSLEEDQAFTRSWNLSYLVRHAVVLRAVIGSGTVHLGGSDWRFQRTLRLYPWLGVVSVDYLFETSDAEVRLADFYDDLVHWKNTDYLPYLTLCGAMTAELAAHTAVSAGPPADLHGGLVRELRAALGPFVEQRPATYAFHDFRTCFVDLRAGLDRPTVHSLLLLTRSKPTSYPDIPGSLTAGGVEIQSSGWATVLRTDPTATARELADVISMFSLIHAQWFVCQLWINVYDQDFRRTPYGRGVASAHELSSSQLALAQDLTEVGNMDLMLKDPALLRVARYFERTLGVRDHRRAAEQRLRLLEEYSRGQADYRQAQATTRLQVLFALSAAGSIAALVPALVEINLARAATTFTIAAVILLWLGFALNYGGFIAGLRWRLRQRVSRRRRARLRRIPQSRGPRG